MKNAKNLLLFAALLAVPAAGSAQESAHFSMGIGLAAQAHPASWSGFGVGSAHLPGSEGAFPGLGAFAHGPSGARWKGYQGGHRGHGHHGGWSPHDCWDYFWYDHWFGCHRHAFAGYPGFGWWYPHPVWWWSFGFPVWPFPHFVGYHRFGFGPVWYGGWDRWYPRRYGGRHYYGHRYVYDGHDRGGHLTPRGYRSGGKAKSRGHSGDRIARGSPLFGPRYKEDPRSQVTDDRRERPVSRAVPRGSRSGAPPRTRATPTRASGPKARPATSSRPKPTVRKTPTRRTTPTTRPATRKPPNPVTRPAPTRRATPKAKAPTGRRPTSGARRAPSRTPAPKAKPTTSRRSSPKARPTPARRPPPKASAPKRSAPKARSAPRRSGTSKPPPRRGGKN